MKCIVKAYAKINLALEVGEIEKDGLHQISTVMQAIELCDEIEIEEQSSELVVTCDDVNVPDGPSNIVYEAVDVLRSMYSIDKGLDIHIKKNIPSSAGLGGGSSDAAAVIKAVDEIWHLGMSLEDKLKVAKKLGSDVPFFFGSGASLVEGTGEVNIGLKPLPAFDVVIVKPPFGVSTKKAYERIDELKANSTFEKARVLAQVMGEQRTRAYWAENLRSYIHNSFLEVVEEEYEEISKLIGFLYKEGAFACGMSGSGSAVFALFDQNNMGINIGSKLGKGQVISTKLHEGFI
jgi:4-diphosphocytidyl-2C-methyl-D-erythritol kinase